MAAGVTDASGTVARVLLLPRGCGCAGAMMGATERQNERPTIWKQAESRMKLFKDSRF